MTYLATFAMLCAAFSLEDDGKSLTLLDGGSPVFVYNYETVEPPRLVPKQQRRSSYIHPLYGLDGEIMTQDFPFDHFHHRGVFWAWPLCRIGDKPLDVWVTNSARQLHEKWIAREAAEDRAEIAMNNIWVYLDAPEKPLIRETVRIIVHPVRDNRRAVDIDLTFENVSGETATFLGAEDKGYGGFCLRPDATRKPMQFTTASGPVSEDQLRFDTPWADVSYAVRRDGPLSGVAFFQHPGNPGYPHPGWIMRHYGFLGVCWPHEEEFALPAGESFQLRYRMTVHRGSADDARIADAFREYTETAKDAQQ